jgi:hypothetical protein
VSDGTTAWLVAMMIARMANTITQCRIAIATDVPISSRPPASNVWARCLIFSRSAELLATTYVRISTSARAPEEATSALAQY